MGEIANNELMVADIPPAGAPWNAIAKFALTFNGYDACGSTGECAAIANARRRDSLTDLRVCLFFEQRRYHHFGWDPEGDTMVYIRDLVEQIRDRVAKADTA